MRRLLTVAAMPLLLGVSSCSAAPAGGNNSSTETDLGSEAPEAPADQLRSVSMTADFGKDKAELQQQLGGQNTHFKYPINVMYAEDTPKSSSFSRLAIVMFSDSGGPGGAITDIFLKDRKSGAWRLVTPTDVFSSGRAFRSKNSWQISGIDRATGLPMLHLPPNAPMNWPSIDMTFDPAIGRYKNIP